MIGEPRLRGVDVRHQVADAVLSVEQDGDDLNARRIGQRMKELRRARERYRGRRGHGGNVSRNPVQSTGPACGRRAGT